LRKTTSRNREKGRKSSVSNLIAFCSHGEQSGGEKKKKKRKTKPKTQQKQGGGESAKPLLPQLQKKKNDKQTKFSENEMANV